MKLKISALFILLFAVYFSANAQILLTENFAYPAGDSIGAHGWTHFSGSANPILVVSPGLTFTGYALSGIGNAAKVFNFGNDNYKDFTAPETAGSVYVAFMVKIDSAKTGDYFLAFLPSTSTTNFNCRVYAKDSVGSILFGVSKNSASGGPIVYSTTLFNYNTTYVVIAKYKFVNGTTTDDEVSLFVFNSAIPGTEPGTPTVGPITGTATDAVDLGRVALRQGTSSSSPIITVDGIRVGKTWANLVSGIQNLSSVADKFSLAQNYPNPFNPETNINFSIPSNGFVNMKIFNILGQEVNTLVNNNLSAGTYNVKFNGVNLMSGVYYCKIEFTSLEGKFFSDIKKLMLVK